MSTSGDYAPAGSSSFQTWSVRFGEGLRKFL